MTHQLSYVSALEKMAKENHQKFATLMPHMGERGRIGEEIIKDVLLKLLPKRFSIGTGIIISSDGQISRQTDIVIYDNINNAPLLTEYSAHLFPIECVYATIEVKTRLTKAELYKSLEAVKLIRSMKDSKAYIATNPDGEPVRVSRKIAPRSYVFGFYQKGLGKDSKAFKRSLAVACDTVGTHIHGVGVLSKNWFANRLPHSNPATINTYEGGALLNLYKAIIEHQTNFSMFPMDVAAYLRPE